MRKERLVNKVCSCLLLAFMLPLLFAGCEEKPGDITISFSEIAEEETDVIGTAEQEGEEGDFSEEAVTEENNETEAVNVEEELFAILSQSNFEFSSGAGAWFEAFNVEKDGFVHGSFHDSNMGETGEGYENGTVYQSNYTGHFGEVTKIDEFTYEMKLLDIAYEKENNYEEIADGVKYSYTLSYCFGMNDSFTIYLPGTPLENISEEVLFWVNMIWGADTAEVKADVLPVVVIADNDNGLGIYSYERPAPEKDAEYTYRTYEESYDYYEDLIANAASPEEKLANARKQYEVMDQCLNYIWILVKYNVEEAEFEQILEEQRTWIKEKENAATEAKNDFEDATEGETESYRIMAKETLERCQELVQKLK